MVLVASSDHDMTDAETEPSANLRNLPSSTAMTSSSCRSIARACVELLRDRDGLRSHPAPDPRALPANLHETA